MTAIAARRAVAAVLLALAAAAPAATETTFDDGPTLGARLLHNVVRVRAADLREHGFGLIVGANSRHLFIVTARHVVADAKGLGKAIGVSFCASDHAGAEPAAAEAVPEFDAGDRDLALLRVLRPASYRPLLETVAPADTLALRQDAWLLGQDDACGVAAGSAAVLALPDAREQMAIEFPGARGGASGGPAISAYGVLGIVTNADDIVMAVQAIEPIARRLRAGGWWQLQPAKNIPLTDPRSAEVDLAETLNRYLFAVRNLHGQLLQPFIPKQRLHQFGDEYSAAVKRFILARDRHDGTLDRHWPAAVLTQWQGLRAALWSVHEPFYALNQGDLQKIYERESAPPEIRARLLAMEPALVALQRDIAAFLQLLGRRSPP